MGKIDLAINITKSLVSDAAKWSKACRKPILATKPTIFHGINPTATYEASGKTFALNRFCSQEMKEARQMNKIAIRQAKAQGIERTYPKATPQDLKRLTSETIEDSYSRVEWTNPKDGKIYNLLKQGETKDGKVKVRILDEQGAFVKEAELTPKKIVMVDAKCQISGFGVNMLNHADAVKLYLRKNNPFAHIEFLDVTGKGESTLGNMINVVDEAKLNNAWKCLETRIVNNEKIDYITMSIGNESKTPSDCSTEIAELINQFLAKSKSGTRVIISSGNKGKSAINLNIKNTRAEGVGSISNGYEQCRISDFSASRHINYTQHYERGVHSVKQTEYGYNITGGTGTDLPYPENVTITKLKKAIDECDEKYLKLDKKLTKVYGLEEIIENNSEMRNAHRKRYRSLIKIGDSIKKEIDQNFSNQRVLREKLNELSELKGEIISGTSFSTPIRTAKLALNDMMRDVL